MLGAPGTPRPLLLPAPHPTLSHLFAPAVTTPLYQTSFRDPLTYGVVAATLLAVSVLASLIPAIRTTRVQPSEALKAE